MDKIKKIYLKLLMLLEKDKTLFYISGSEKLPEILSPEEERSLLLKLQDDDSFARSRLIEKNLRLVVYIAKKFENSKINIEDLISIGTIGLIKAVKSFKIEKNIKLATYASRCIENEILMFLRKNNKRKGEMSIEEPINTDSEGNKLVLSDIIGTDPDSIFKFVEDEDNKKILKEAITHLNDRDMVIMNLRYGFNGTEELTQKEVASMLGISQSYISRIEKKVIKDLKKSFFK